MCCKGNIIGDESLAWLYLILSIMAVIRKQENWQVNGNQSFMQGSSSQSLKHACVVRPGIGQGMKWMLHRNLFKMCLTENSKKQQSKVVVWVNCSRRQIKRGILCRTGVWTVGSQEPYWKCHSWKREERDGSEEITTYYIWTTFKWVSEPSPLKGILERNWLLMVILNKGWRLWYTLIYFCLKTF